MKHDYPAWICSDCGNKWGRKECGVATWHEDECGVCGFVSLVTEPRDYGHLKDGWQKGKTEMTEIERKALELVNEVAQDVRYEPDDFEEERRDVFKALCRAIEQHEAFRQEVSDAVIEAVARLIKDGNPDCGVKANAILSRFIITKPDPLVEALNEAYPYEMYGFEKAEAEELRAALAKRGLEIREKSND